MCDSATICRVVRNGVGWVWSADSRVVAVVVAGSCCTVALVDYRLAVVVVDCRLALLVADIVVVVPDTYLVADRNRDRCNVDHRNRHRSRCCGNRRIVLVAGIVAVVHSPLVARVAVELVVERANDRRWLGNCR